MNIVRPTKNVNKNVTSTSVNVDIYVEYHNH